MTSGDLCSKFRLLLASRLRIPDSGDCWIFWTVLKRFKLTKLIWECFRNIWHSVYYLKYIRYHPKYIRHHPKYIRHYLKHTRYRLKHIRYRLKYIRIYQSSDQGTVQYHVVRIFMISDFQLYVETRPSALCDEGEFNLIWWGFIANFNLPQLTRFICGENLRPKVHLWKKLTTFRSGW